MSVAARPPLSLAIFRAPDGIARPVAVGQDAFRRSLTDLRHDFASLGRAEATIFQFDRRGAKREILLGLFLSGADARGGLRQTGGKIRMTLVPAGAGAWRMESGRVESWLTASAPEPLFENVAERAGLARPHRAFLPNAAKNIPIPGEHMPPGAAVLDFDRDGRQDLFVPGGDGNRLYKNRGDGTFEDVAGPAGVAGQEGEGIGALAFDYDNDGDSDLYVTYLLRPNLLYRNRGDGTFEEVGAAAGVDLNEYCTSSAALDYDRDGDADLYVLVYGHPDYGPTLEADNAPPNHLYRNDGNGKFTDVSKPTRTDDTRWALALQSADLDGDLWPDIYVANDFGDHTYLHNQGDGTFRNAAKAAGVLDPAFGMGVTVDDYDGDGRLDFFVSNYSFPLNWFLRDSRYPMPPFPYSLGRPLVWRRLTKLSRGSSLFRNLGDNRFDRPFRGGRRLGHVLVLGLGFRRCGPGRARRPLRRQRNGDRPERDRARDRLLEPDVGRVQQVREGHPDRRVRRRLALGPAAQALLPQPRRPALRRARRGHGPGIPGQPAWTRGPRRGRRRRSGSLRLGLPPAERPVDQPQPHSTRRRSSSRSKETPGPKAATSRRATPSARR